MRPTKTYGNYGIYIKKLKVFGAVTAEEIRICQDIWDREKMRSKWIDHSGPYDSMEEAVEKIGKLTEQAASRRAAYRRESW